MPMQRTMREVQPVWWVAPRPRPVSPWKYSWNQSKSYGCFDPEPFDRSAHGKNLRDSARSFAVIGRKPCFIMNSSDAGSSSMGEEERVVRAVVCFEVVDGILEGFFVG